MLQDGNPHADPYKAENYELNSLDVGEYFKQVSLCVYPSFIDFSG